MLTKIRTNILRNFWTNLSYFGSWKGKEVALEVRHGNWEDYMRKNRFSQYLKHYSLQESICLVTVHQI